MTADSPTKTHRRTVTRACAEGMPFSPTFLAAIATHLTQKASSRRRRRRCITKQREQKLTFRNRPQHKIKRASGRFAIDRNRTTKEQRSSKRATAVPGRYVKYEKGITRVWWCHSMTLHPPRGFPASPVPYIYPARENVNLRTFTCYLYAAVG